MTENLPAVRRDPAPATIDVDSWTAVVADVAKLAAHIADTEFVSKALRGSAPAVAAAILYGREVGLPPMTALNMTHVVEGKPGLSAEGMRALVLAAGHQIEFIESTGAVCKMRARRRGSDHWTELSWTLDMARAAGVAGKNVWKSYPRAMLQARCTTELARMVFPDVIHGFRSVEELEDLSDEPGQLQQPAPSGGTSKVTRKRAPARKAAQGVPPPPDGAQRPTGPVGPPLPGEEGYDAPVGSASPQGGVQTSEGGVSGDGDATSGGDGASSGEDREGTPPSGPDAPGSEEAAPMAATEPSDPGVQAGGEAGAGDHAHDGSGPAEPATPPTEDRRGRGPSTRAQHRMIFSQLAGLYGDDDVPDEERYLIASSIVEREVESFNQLTKADAQKVIDTLAQVRDREVLMRLLDTIDEARALREQAEAGQDEPS